MKKLTLLSLLLCSQAFSATLSSGDSITAGASATAGNSYIQLLGPAIGSTITNYAVSGDQAADQAVRTYGVTMGANDRATLMIGTNDQWRYAASSYKQDLYRTFLTGIVANFSLAAKVNGNSSGMTYTGSWSASQPAWARGKWSYNAGATATATVSGTAVYVGTIRQDDLNGNPINGTADVYIDSVKVGTIGSAGTGMTTQNGNAYAPAAYRFGGLSAGSHTVQLVVTSTYADYRGILYLEYIAGSDQFAKPKVYASSILRYSTYGYSTVGGSDANMAIYNGIVSDVVTNAIADGLAVKLVDSSAAVNQSTDLSTDGVHPVDTGHAKIKNAFYQAITGGTTYLQNSLFKGSDGKWYVDDGTGKQLLTLP